VHNLATGDLVDWKPWSRDVNRGAAVRGTDMLGR